ncbi:hypothetical protein V6Z11_A09G190500 [Gossypium hirsutum]
MWSASDAINCVYIDGLHQHGNMQFMGIPVGERIKDNHGG